MKKILFTAVAAVCLLTAGRGLAQDRRHALQAQIPFDFCVGNSSLPAGSYLLGQLPKSQGFLVVRNSATGEEVLNFASTEPYAPREYRGKLVFHRYGDQYFLSEVHETSGALDMSLPVSAREKQARLELTNVQVYEQDIVPQQ